MRALNDVARGLDKQVIAEWVETHYTPLTVDRVMIYDLTQPPRNS